MKRKVISVFMVVIISMQLFTGCSILSKNKSSSPYDKFIVVDVFDTLANFQGIQSGWFAKIVKDKFNMQLNIIAPNKAGGGDTLFDTRAASGNVGDLIICGTENGKFQDLVDEGLVLNMNSMLKGKDIMRYKTAINSVNEKLTQSGIYAIPSEISTLKSTESCEGLELTFGPYLRWDIYASVGYPEMSTLEDLLPVLKKMQSGYPVTESKNPTYGFSFFKDWDNHMLTYAKQPACFYGYDELGFILAKADGTDLQNIVDKDSFYMRNIKLYYEANKLGLVDPDSSTQSYQDMFAKYQDGAILYCPWPWCCQSAFNTTSNKENGKGYMLAPIKDMKVFSYGCISDGNQKVVIAIGSQAEDPQRMADFINWLYSPEGIEIQAAQDCNGTAGPEGLTWEMKDGKPYLTEFGKKVLYGNNTVIPDSWGGGTWEDGVSQLNYCPVSKMDNDPKGNPYYYTLWDSVLKAQYTPLDIDWRTHLKTNAISTHEYLEDHNQIMIAPGCSYVTPDESSDITTIRNLCKSVVVDSSWKMIFAQNDTEFKKIYNAMIKKLKSYDYDKVLKQDFKNAKQQDLARKEAAAESTK
jgi:multiple sugar transport system substrate-binding protein/putative aldouronate transport system substrate-binding protein